MRFGAIQLPNTQLKREKNRRRPSNWPRAARNRTRREGLNLIASLINANGFLFLFFGSKGWNREGCRWGEIEEGWLKRAGGFWWASSTPPPFSFPAQIRNFKLNFRFWIARNNRGQLMFYIPGAPEGDRFDPENGFLMNICTCIATRPFFLSYSTPPPIWNGWANKIKRHKVIQFGKIFRAS